MKRATSTDTKGLFLVAISIHALVKRATAAQGKALKALVISIHALVKRATNLLNPAVIDR